MEGEQRDKLVKILIKEVEEATLFDAFWGDDA